MKLKSHHFFILIFIFIFSCRSSYQIPPDVIRIFMGQEPPTLNPITSADAYAASIQGYVFDSLIERDNDTFEFKPKIAERWEVSDDKKTYTFYLRKDVTWHDGKPMTADDVVFSYNLLMDPKTNAPALKVYYQDIDNVKKLDDYTVEFHYSKIYFLGLSICGYVPIVPKHIVEKYPDFEASDFSRHPVGNGPYVFKEWRTGNKIVLVRNENYWGEKPEIRVIEFKLIADPDIGLQVLKKGELDYYSLTSVQWAKQTNSEKFSKMFYKFAYPSPGYGFVGWNNEHPIFSDPRVRRAMTHMIDLETVVKKLYFGLGKIVNGTFFPYSKQYNTQIEPHGYNPAKAREILAEVGWKDSDGDGILDKNGKNFEFTFLYPSGNNARERMLTILKEDLRKAGIEMNLLKIEWAAFLDRINRHDFEATSLGWSSPYDMDPYQIFDISQADIPNSSNFISYRNQAASDLIRAARVEFDENKRNQLYWQFQEIIHEDQPYTFLFSSPSTVAVSKRFTNVKPHKSGLDLLEWKIKK